MMKLEMKEGVGNRILDINFNQDFGCFSISTEKGYRIFNTYPFKDTIQNSFDHNSGIGMTTMLFRSNILALVGGGVNPKYPPNKVIIWDDRQSKCIGELSFKADVKNIRMRRDRMVVVLEQRIYVYSFPDLKLLDIIDTYINPQGLCVASPNSSFVLVYPDKKKGTIRIRNYEDGVDYVIDAHESAINALAISQDGKLCATASNKGTLVRVFSTHSEKALGELRRGSDKADIQSIAFDKSSYWLACNSDKGTIHIFSLARLYGEDIENAKNKTSMFSFMKGIIPYFKSEWSLAKFRIPESRSVIAFTPTDDFYIIVITYDGKYYLAEFDPKTRGECRKLIEKQFMEHSN